MPEERPDNEDPGGTEPASGSDTPEASDGVDAPETPVADDSKTPGASSEDRSPSAAASDRAEEHGEEEQETSAGSEAAATDDEQPEHDSPDSDAGNVEAQNATETEPPEVDSNTAEPATPTLEDLRAGVQSRLDTILGCEDALRADIDRLNKRLAPLQKRAKKLRPVMSLKEGWVVKLYQQAAQVVREQADTIDALRMDVDWQFNQRNVIAEGLLDRWRRFEQITMNPSAEWETQLKDSLEELKSFVTENQVTISADEQRWGLSGDAVQDEPAEKTVTSDVAGDDAT